jgi:hypothetical protein
MPIDYNYEHTPSFRELTRTGMFLIRQPFVSSLDKLRKIRASVVDAKLVPIAVKSTKRFRRSS